MVLFLYSELASYTISCVNELLKSGEEVHIVRWPVNKEAPFSFDFKGITILERTDFTDSELIAYAEKIQPDVIISSGWMDKGYLKVNKHFKNRIPTVLTLDNHWTGGAKQKLASVISPFFLKSKFSHVWVPGAPQVEYAKRLRFSADRIHTGFYSADVGLFHSFYQEFKLEKEKNPPKVFIYLGRYIEHKGIFDMWKAFIEIVEERNDENWEFWCFGTGDQFDKKIIHPKIKHHGFVQPTELAKYIQKTGVYILPSHFEPWGVSLHEFAAAGYPLLASREVGSSETFLKEGLNGYAFDAGSVDEIKSAMSKIMSLNNEEIVAMQKKSHAMSTFISPKIWVETYFKIKNSMKS